MTVSLHSSIQYEKNAFLSKHLLFRSLNISQTVRSLQSHTLSLSWSSSRAAFSTPFFMNTPYREDGFQCVVFSDEHIRVPRKKQGGYPYMIGWCVMMRDKFCVKNSLNDWDSSLQSTTCDASCHLHRLADVHICSVLAVAVHSKRQQSKQTKFLKAGAFGEGRTKLPGYQRDTEKHLWRREDRNKRV